MKKVLRLIIAFATLLIVIMSVSVLSHAEEVGKVIYKNDFSNNKLDDTMWYSAIGTQVVTDEFGEYVLRCSGGTSRLNFGPEEVKNVDLSFRIKARELVTKDSAYFGVYFRSFSIPANALFAHQLRFNNSKVSLVRMNNHLDTKTVVLTEESSINIKKAGLWYNVKICLRENRIVIYVNGIKIVDFEDDTTPAYGGFGVVGSQYKFDIDDINMVEYTSKVLPEPTPNEAPLWVGLEGTDEEPEFADTGEERLNLFGSTSEKKDTSVSALAPGEMTLGRWLAVGMITICFMIAISIAILVLISKKVNYSNKNAKTEFENNVFMEVNEIEKVD